MSVVVGYVATPEGEAALATATAEARRRGVPVVVVVSERGHLG
ncbi:MAG TPA: universal stress protein, partial [Actinotalea sp.]|nr:universal stress protein [Actinotalea sp.]